MNKLRTMVVCLAAAAALAVPQPAPAEEVGGVLLELESLGWGGYAGPQFKPTALAGSFCLYGGGPVVILAGPAAGFGLNVGLPEGDAGGRALRYAALRGQYIFPTRSPAPVLRRLHFSLALDVGGGLASHGTERAAAVVIEPEALVSVSLWSSFRVGLGASYRLAVLLEELASYSPLALSGPAGVVALQYGLFPAPRRSTEEAR